MTFKDRTIEILQFEEQKDKNLVEKGRKPQRFKNNIKGLILMPLKIRSGKERLLQKKKIHI